MKTWAAPSFEDCCRSGRTQRTDKSTKLIGSRDTSERAQEGELARAGKRKQAGQGRKQGGKRGADKEGGEKQG